MPIKRVLPSGYCMGVVKAIEQVKRVVKENPHKPVYVLGMLVHNKYVVEALRCINVITLEDSHKTKEELLDTIDQGIVVFSAHGISDHIKQKAINKGLEIVDASCPFVLNNRKLIQEYLDLGYEILYIGKENHPEAEAIISISEKVHLITNESSLDNSWKQKKLFVTNQTTMSINDIKDIMENLKEQFPEAVFAPEVCDATRLRQQAIIDLVDVDTLIVVGDPKSNNTTQLVKIAQEAGIKEVYKVESAKELPDLRIDVTKNIAVTAGASTPRSLTDNIISYLETGDSKYLEVDIKKILN